MDALSLSKLSSAIFTNLPNVDVFLESDGANFAANS